MAFLASALALAALEGMWIGGVELTGGKLDLFCSQDF